jgi:hypothetical protein
MYLVLLGAIGVSACIFLNNSYKDGRKYFCVTTAILMILYASLRSKYLYTDTPGYVEKYLSISKYSFIEALNLFDADMKNPSFYFLGWIVGKVFSSGQVWLAFLSILYIVAFMHLIYKESKIPLISVIVFLSLGYFTFSLTGLRQALAMTLIVPAYYFAKNNKIVNFILVVLLAYLFHNSALIFLLIYPIRNLKLGWFHVLSMGICLAFSLIFKSEFKAFIGEIFKDSHYGGYSESNKVLNFSGIIIQLAIFAFNLLYYKNNLTKNKGSLILYNCAFLGLSFQLFSLVIAEMFRVSMYFSIFNIVLIPLSIIAEPNEKWRKVEMILITVVLLAYIFVGGLPNYSFFWN